MVIKAVVFDFGGVIMSLAPLGKHFMKIADEMGVDIKTFIEKKDLIWDLIANDSDLMTGKITGDYFEEVILLKALNQMFGTNHTKPIRIFKNILGTEGITYHEPILELIRKLRENGFKTALLTNNLHIDEEKKIESVLVDRALFDVVVESRHEGIEKPNQEIYQLCHNRILALDESVKPSEVIFLDDTKINLDGAEKFGWKTVHVEMDPTNAISQVIQTIQKENGISLSL